MPLGEYNLDEAVATMNFAGLHEPTIRQTSQVLPCFSRPAQGLEHLWRHVPRKSLSASASCIVMGGSMLTSRRANLHTHLYLFCFSSF